MTDNHTPDGRDGPMRRRTTRLPFALVALATALAACTPATEDASPPQPTPSASASPSPQTGESPSDEPSVPADQSAPEDPGSAAPTSFDDPERPGPDTTGVPGDIVLEERDERLVVKEDGAVVEGLDTTREIDIKANDVTIRNVRVTYDGNGFAIRTYDGFSGTTIEDSTIILEQASDGGVPGAGVQGGSDTTVRRTEISGVTDGIKASTGSTYEDNWIHLALADGSDKHLDAIQNGVSDLVIRGNFLDVPHSEGGNAAYINTTFSETPPSNILIENNWLNGGAFTLFVGRTKEGDYMEDVRVVGNVFGSENGFGVVTSDDDPDLVFEGNVVP